MSPLRACVDALPDPAERSRRAVTIPKKGTAVDRLCQLAQAIGRSDRAFSALSRQELEDTLNLGVVQRECRRSQVSLLTRPTDVAWLKKQLFEKRGWSGAEAEEEQPPEDQAEGDQFVVEKILAARRTPAGVQEVLVQWAGTNECHWLARASVAPTAPDVLAEFDAQQVQQPLPVPQPVPAVGAGSAAPEWAGQLAAGIQALLGAHCVQSKKADKRKSKADSDSDSDDDDDRAPWEKPALSGDKRLAKIGFSHFQRERGLRRTRELTNMKPHEPFATEFNEENAVLVNVELRLIDMELKLEAAQEELVSSVTEEDKAAAEAKLVALKARMKVTKEQWMLSEDKLELISGCSQLSLKGKHHVACGMLQDWRKRTTETSAMKEFNKRQKKAETRLKHEAEMDQGLFIARQLGQESSMLSGAQHQGARLQWGPGLQAGNPPSYPTSGYPSYPPPPPQRPMPAIQAPPGQLALGGPVGRGPNDQRRRCRMEDAESVLSQCHPKLKGTMLPVGMKFFTDRKLLSDSKYDRMGRPFLGACKACGTVGHEAFECEEQFQFEGKPAMGYRAAFKMGLCDAHGRYK